MCIEGETLIINSRESNWKTHYADNDNNLFYAVISVGSGFGDYQLSISNTKKNTKLFCEKTQCNFEYELDNSRGKIIRLKSWPFL
jgi:hypothetical protein